jgi:CheY-like chemotaxis protein
MLAVLGAAPVLVVDDDPEIRDVLREVLELAGRAVVEAADGRAALAAAAARAPALILLDVRMPLMDGLAFASAYRARSGRPAPIILMTGREDPAAAVLATGADALLPKPFDLGDVLALVRRLG